MSGTHTVFMVDFALAEPGTGQIAARSVPRAR